MTSLSQASWFTENLIRHWPFINRSNTRTIIEKLSDDAYMELKRLYYKGFASSDTKPVDLSARAKLDAELLKLGIFN